MSEAFRQLGLGDSLVQAVAELGYEHPTPIQEGAIPALLAGRDVFGQAQTGTGKTAAFALPILEHLDQRARHVQALVLAPTRELALQVAEAFYQYGKHMRVRALAIYGGSSYARQLKKLEEGVQVVVGTPGRLIDLIQRGALDLSDVRFVVLDEADEMLKMGFIDDVQTILGATPDERQTALFSATLSDPIRRLAREYMRDPIEVTIAQKAMTVPQVTQRYHLVFEESKVPAVARLLEGEDVTSALIFTRTKLGAAELADKLIARGFPVEAIHGDLNQEAREVVLRRFRRGNVKVLVATDVAARGLDIEGVSHVVNFDMPYDPEDYVHRIGRTGRAGREGVAVTLVTPRERRWLRTIEQFTRQPIARQPLPTAEQIYALRDARFQATLDEAMADLSLDKERQFIARLVESGYDMEQLAAASLRLARADQKRPVEPIEEPTSREPRPDFVRRNGERSNDRGGERNGRFDRRSDRSTDRRSAGAPRRDEGERAGEAESRPRRRSPGETEPGMVRLTMNVGREQGIRPGDVVGAIASEAGIPGRAIGAIDIRRNETYFDVMEDHVERVLRQMTHGTLRGQQVSLKRANS